MIVDLLLVRAVGRPHDPPELTAELMLTLLFGALRPELLTEAGPTARPLPLPDPLVQLLGLSPGRRAPPASASTAKAISSTVATSGGDMRSVAPCVSLASTPRRARAAHTVPAVAQPRVDVDPRPRPGRTHRDDAVPDQCVQPRRQLTAQLTRVGEHGRVAEQVDHRAADRARQRVAPERAAVLARAAARRAPPRPRPPPTAARSRRRAPCPAGRRRRRRPRAGSPAGARCARGPTAPRRPPSARRPGRRSAAPSAR